MIPQVNMGLAAPSICRSCQRRLYSSKNPRTYADAISALNTLQANHATVMRVRANPDAMQAVAIPEMHSWLQRAGYQASDFNSLNAIHIAGTKGKGSTSAFVASILAQYIPGASSSSPLLEKVGLYTSPHLRFVRERIQLNNELISAGAFAQRFFEIWDRLEDASLRDGPMLEATSPDGVTRPAYFRYLTLMALHTFLKESVDAAVVECGVGGEYDSTNVLQKPAVTGITSLGLDHQPMLGETIESIAWHKAGIMKAGVKCFTVPQPGKANDQLRKVAAERGADLRFIDDIHPQVSRTELGLQGEFQKINASLAVPIAAEYLRSRGHASFEALLQPGHDLPDEFKRGLANAYIGGRCETRVDSNAPINWRIDGAHTLESMEAAANWFATCAKSTASKAPKGPRILLFNQQTREAVALLTKLNEVLTRELGSGLPFTHAIFCTNRTFVDTGFRPDLISLNSNQTEVENLQVQEQLSQAWKVLAGHESCETQIFVTIEEAINECRRIAQGTENNAKVEVFASGSMHLVGGVLEVLDS